MGDKWAAYAKRPHFFGAGSNPPVYYRGLIGLTGTYVDIGVGDGAKLKYSIDEGCLSGFHTIRAFDISPDRIRRLREHVPSVVGEVGDALALPLPDQSVNFAIADQVIEHVDDDRAMAREIRRILAPSGRALIGSVMKMKGAWWFYRCNGQWRLDPTHLREYVSLQEFAEVFDDAGLEVVELAHLPLTYPAADLLLRALLTVRILKPDAAVGLKERMARRGVMSGVTLRIPRYYTCYALVQQPGNGASGKGTGVSPQRTSW